MSGSYIDTQHEERLRLLEDAVFGAVFVVEAPDNWAVIG